MSKTYMDSMATMRAALRSQRILCFVIAGMGALGMYYAGRQPKEIDVHFAPHIQAGDSVQVRNGESDIAPVNVYGFAYYIFQQINRWQRDGFEDYGKQIFLFQSYITPACQAQLNNDMQDRAKKGELTSRTRFVTEIPGFGFSDQRVIAEGTNAWTVKLDLQLQESFKGQQIKDVFIRYPVRVVRYDVDREKNPWKLAIDCYGDNRPERLNSADIAAIQGGKKALELPTQIAPASLPGVNTHPGVSSNLEVSAEPAPSAPAVTNPPATPATPAAPVQPGTATTTPQ
ncbi:PFL_4703 family integrating conjugative element protein [Comamonas jiangduensis]|uniref:PFL_4703 family integrating conjugative element protein n=1 Tax=Comamonas jiangduensis TaxID=1194168 RepID=UPI003BF7DB0B